MAADPLQPQRLRDLATDLAVERRRLEALIESLAGLAERCLLQVVRVLNGGTPEGADWHRRLLDRLTLATEHRPALLSSDTARALGLLLGFRHVVRRSAGLRSLAAGVDCPGRERPP